MTVRMVERLGSSLTTRNWASGTSSSLRPGLEGGVLYVPWLRRLLSGEKVDADAEMLERSRRESVEELAVEYDCRWGFLGCRGEGTRDLGRRKVLVFSSETCGRLEPWSSNEYPGF